MHHDCLQAFPSQKYADKAPSQGSHGPANLVLEGVPRDWFGGFGGRQDFREPFPVPCVTTLYRWVVFIDW